MNAAYQARTKVKLRSASKENSSKVMLTRCWRAFLMILGPIVLKVSCWRFGLLCSIRSKAMGQLGAEAGGEVIHCLRSRIARSLKNSGVYNHSANSIRQDQPTVLLYSMLSWVGLSLHCRAVGDCRRLRFAYASLNPRIVYQC